MHRPDLKRPADKQDKRMVVILPESRYEDWLDAPVERSMEFMTQHPPDRLVMTAEPPPPKQGAARLSAPPADGQASFL